MGDNIELYHLENLIPVAVAFALGGLLKGATGAGAPIVAVPLLAILYDVKFAVAVFVIPSLVSNIWQLWEFRDKHLTARFSLSFAGAGAAGAVLGSFMLAALPSRSLMVLVAIGVFAYISSRLLWRDWKLGMSAAKRIVFPVGFAAGVLQGSTGVSAPLSITFLSSMRLERVQFVATISSFFMAISVVQIVMLTKLQILGDREVYYGCLALVPLIAFMPVGTLLIRYVSRVVFDRVIMTMLFVLAVKLMYDAMS